MSFLFAREIIIGFAVLGGIASHVALFMRSRAGVAPVWTVRRQRLAHARVGIRGVLLTLPRPPPPHPREPAGHPEPLAHGEETR